jgi:hypothetical protein
MSARSKGGKQVRENLTIGDLLREGSNKFRKNFLIAYFVPIIAILTIDFLLFGLIFKEFLMLSAEAIFVGLALAPSRKVWHLLAMFVPYFLLFWVLKMFPEYLVVLVLIPISAIIVHAIYQFYLLKKPDISPRLQGIRWVAPVLGLSLWRFQLTYVIFASMFIFLPVTWPPNILLVALVIILILWIVVPVVVVMLGLRKARDLTLPFLGTIVEK